MSEDKEPQGKHMGVMKIDKRILATLMGLPEGASIVAVDRSLLDRNTLRVRIEHPALPLTEGGLAVLEFEGMVSQSTHAMKIDWSRDMPGTEPTIRPDPKRVAHLLMRLLAAIDPDKALADEVRQAVQELDPYPLPATGEGVRIPDETSTSAAKSDTPQVIDVKYVATGPGEGPVEGKMPVSFRTGIAGSGGGIRSEPSFCVSNWRLTDESVDQPFPELITAPDERMRCMVLLPNGERCEGRSRWHIGTNPVDDYACACDAHKDTVTRPEDKVEELEEYLRRLDERLDALPCHYDVVAAQAEKMMQGKMRAFINPQPQADEPHKIEWRQWL